MLMQLHCTGGKVLCPDDGKKRTWLLVEVEGPSMKPGTRLWIALPRALIPFPKPLQPRNMSPQLIVKLAGWQLQLAFAAGCCS